MTSLGLALTLLVLATAACGSRTDLGAPSEQPSDGGTQRFSDTGTRRRDTGTDAVAREVACLLLGAATAEVDGGTGATWLWTGAGCTEDAVAGPLTRENPAVGVLGEDVVVFGGASSGTFGGGNLNDTWVWRGASWTQQQVGVAPSARENAAFAAQGSGLVLFGGQAAGGGAGGLGDTWVWDGAAWTQQFPSHSPSARYAAAAAPAGSTVVLFGGLTAGPDAEMELLADTWQWDGTDWTELSPAESPPARAGAMSATFDTGAVLFGGVTGAGLTPDCLEGVCFYDDTWLWDGSTWTSAPVAGASPSARAFGSAGTLGTSFVLYGGESPNQGANGSPDLADTWIWDGSTWTQWLEPGPSGFGGSGALGCY
jgi:hypothetical protein